MLARNYFGSQTSYERLLSGETGTNSQKLKKITFGGAIIHKIWYLAQSSSINYTCKAVQFHGIKPTNNG